MYIIHNHAITIVKDTILKQEVDGKIPLRKKNYTFPPTFLDYLANKQALPIAACLHGRNVYTCHL